MGNSVAKEEKNERNNDEGRKAIMNTNTNGNSDSTQVQLQNSAPSNQSIDLLGQYF